MFYGIEASDVWWQCSLSFENSVETKAMTVDDFVELDQFLNAFAKSISSAKKKNIINDDFFMTTTCNRGYVAHSRIHALIVKTGFDLDYVVEVEAGFKPVQGNQFKADVQLWKSDELMFLIEYESTNSSDSRVIWGDLQKYVKSMSNDLGRSFPKYWLIIYTLPDQAVDDWSRWDFNESDYAFELLRENPHQFYKRGFEDPAYLCSLESPKGCPHIAEYPGISEFTQGKNWNSRKIFLINLTVKGLEIDFPKRFSKEYCFE